MPKWQRNSTLSLKLRKKTIALIVPAQYMRNSKGVFVRRGFGGERKEGKGLKSKIDS